MAEKKAKTYKSCAHCGDAHHHFAACADGYRAIKTPRFGIERSQYTSSATLTEAVSGSVALPEASPEAPEAATAQAPSPASPSAAEQARSELAALVDSLPTDSPQRASLALLLERDEARTKHAEAEADLRTRTGNPDAHLPVPTILRDRREDAGRFLEGELNRVLAVAGEARDPRARPPLHEVMATKEFFATKDERDEQKAVEDIMRTAPLEGGTNWICRNEPTCGERFKSAPMEEVRRYAKEHYGWMFVCQKCKSPRVELIQLSVAS